VLKRLLGVGAVLLVMLIGVASASAATGSTVPLAAGTNAEHPAVAVTSTGTAIATWADKTVPGSNLVRWCVIAPGAGGCSAGGSLAAAGEPAGATYINGTQVLYEGSSLVILADLQAGTKTEYESVQGWQSTDGGRSFNPMNGGKAIASGIPVADTQMLNAVNLPGATSIGVGFDSAAEAPSFHAFAVAAPTLCGRATFPATNCADGIATLAPKTDVDQVGNAPGNFATDGASVMGIFRTNAAAGNLGCPGASPFGMAYTFGTGLQGPSNNYNVSPGTAATAWRKSVTLSDCGVDYLAVGSGPSGFGVLEDNQLTRQTQYHRFNSVTQTFTAVPTVVSTAGEQQPSVSQDGAGGVYATYLSGGIGGPVSVSYSFDGGTTWSGPGPLAADPLGRIAGLTSAVDAAGQGWAVWTENGTVFGQQFTAADSVAPPAPTTLSTVQKGGGKSGASLSILAGTTGETDQATIAGANAAKATGTMTYTLYQSPSCQASSKISSNTVPVSGALAPPSAPVTVTLAPGRYYWQAAYSGNAGNTQGALGNAPSTSACGGEVLSIGSPNTISPQATTDGQTVTVTVSCATLPCTVQLALTAPASAGGGKGKDIAQAGKGKKKPKAIVLAKGKFKIKKKGPQKLKLKLSAKGRGYFKGKGAKAKATLAVTDKVGGHNVVTKRAVTVKKVARR
jgi:hypothetical protein